MASATRRWIEFFEEFDLMDPETREPIVLETGNKARITNADFMTKVMGNPLWTEGYAQAKAQDNIMAAFEKAKDAKETGYWIGDDDWKFLKKAADEPRFLFLKNGGAIVQSGFGYHPSMSRQFVKAQAAIIEAMTEEEKTKFEAKLRAAQPSLQATA